MQFFTPPIFKQMHVCRLPMPDEQTSLVGLRTVYSSGMSCSYLSMGNLHNSSWPNLDSPRCARGALKPVYPHLL